MAKEKHKHNPLFVLEEANLFEDTTEREIFVMKGLLVKDDKYAEEPFDLAVGDSNTHRQDSENETYVIPLFTVDDESQAREKIANDMLTLTPGKQPRSRWFIMYPGRKRFSLYQTSYRDDLEVVSQEYYLTNFPLLKKRCSVQKVSKIEKDIKQPH